MSDVDDAEDVLIALSALGRALAKCISDERGTIPPLLAPIVYQCLEGQSQCYFSLAFLTYSTCTDDSPILAGRGIAHRDACSPSDLAMLLLRVDDIDPQWKRTISSVLYDRNDMQHVSFSDVALKYVPTGIGISLPYFMCLVQHTVCLSLNTGIHIVPHQIPCLL